MLKSLWLIFDLINLITTKLHLVPLFMIQFHWNPKTYANLILWFRYFSIFFFFDLSTKITFFLHQNQSKKDEHVFFTISLFFNDDKTHLWEVFAWCLKYPPYIAYLPYLLQYMLWCLWYPKKIPFLPLFDIIKNKRNKVQRIIIILWKWYIRHKDTDLLHSTNIWSVSWYQYWGFFKKSFIQWKF